MAMPAAFDPLVDFDDMWTTKLAERYLPLLDLPRGGAAGGREFVTSDPFEMRFTPHDLVP